MNIREAAGTMADHTCVTCPYWEAGAKDQGVCRHDPPAGHVNVYERPWPTTKAKDWCSKHPVRFPFLEMIGGGAKAEGLLATLEEVRTWLCHEEEDRGESDDNYPPENRVSEILPRVIETINAARGGGAPYIKPGAEDEDG